MALGPDPKCDVTLHIFAYMHSPRPLCTLYSKTVKGAINAAPFLVPVKVDLLQRFAPCIQLVNISFHAKPLPYLHICTSHLIISCVHPIPLATPPISSIAG